MRPMTHVGRCEKLVRWRGLSNFLGHTKSRLECISVEELMSLL